MEDGVAILVADKELVLVQKGCTQLPQAEEIVGEARHDVSGMHVLRGDGRDAELGRCH